MRVLIVGCGELGSRHLQAVAALPDVTEIEVVDPRSSALEVGQARLADAPGRQPGVSVRWLPALDEASAGGDLCIVATQADVRCQVVRTATEALGYRAFLLEKVVAQSVTDYRGLLAFAQTRGLAVWVNCKSRAYPSHQRVKAHLKAGEPLVVHVSAGNHGLANNGIHVADIFAFYDDATRITAVETRIDDVLHPSKRGAHVFDLSGLLHGYSENGSALTISFSADSDAPAVFTVASPRYRAVVDDMMKCFYESSEESGWAWRQVPIEGDFRVSAMTREFAADILARRPCRLPTLGECLAAHQFILEALEPHFRRLLDREIDRCPVT